MQHKALQHCIDTSFIRTYFSIKLKTKYVKRLDECLFKRICTFKRVATLAAAANCTAVARVTGCYEADEAEEEIQISSHFLLVLSKQMFIIDQFCLPITHPHNGGGFMRAGDVRPFVCRPMCDTFR